MDIKNKRRELNVTNQLAEQRDPRCDCGTCCDGCGHAFICLANEPAPPPAAFEPPTTGLFAAGGLNFPFPTTTAPDSLTPAPRP